ncbi:unnamed protein product [Strongylus vulgaris]|uniref:Uncharacterized protein n=1 Tax=Strongylus vulgaris TaxID=40348 RepID=A0A3P7KZF9_STRVU|nr:unnamed protein product [Strongylus vulgaris]
MKLIFPSELLSFHDTIISKSLLPNQNFKHSNQNPFVKCSMKVTTTSSATANVSMSERVA